MKQRLKRTLASLSALAMVFTTAAVLPNGAFDSGRGITASAEDSAIEETGTWLEVSCAENNYKTIDYTSSDGKTYTCYVYSSTEYSAVLISVGYWSYIINGDGAYGYDDQIADLASKGARMPKFAELKIKTDAGEQYTSSNNFSCQEYGVVWFSGGEWKYQRGDKYDGSRYCAAFDLNRNPIATVSDSLTTTCTSPALSTVKGEDLTWQGDCEATLTYYDADKTELATAPTALGDYYVKVSVPVVDVTEDETTTRYEASESDYIPFTIGHKITEIPAKDASCTEDGNTEYWYCSECGKYFSDSNGENEIEPADTVISAKEHSLTAVSAKSATCTEVGNIAYWYCSVCGKYFSDSKGENEIKLADTVTYAKVHKLTAVSAKSATCTEVGNIAYWYCSECGKYFSDSKGEKEIALADTVVSETDHDFGTQYYYDQESHWKACANCDETDEISAHTIVDGVCEVCGISEEYVNSAFAVNGSMNFYLSADKGNWTENATLAENGYEWNADSKTLTLGNIYIDGDLILPYDGETNTIVIADGAAAVVSGKIGFYPFQTSLTVEGNGVLKAGFDNGNVGSDDLLTIASGVTVVTDFMMWSTNGGILIEGKLDVSEYIFTEKIELQDDAQFEIDVNTGISSYGSVENGFAALQNNVHEGYEVVKVDSTVFIVPEGSTVKWNTEAGKYEVRDENGNEITGKAGTNHYYENGVCTVCGAYEDGIGAKLAGYSLNLSGSIGVDFYMELDESVIDDDTAYMQFTLPNGDISEIMVSDAEKQEVDGKTYYVFGCYVAAKEMTDTITAQIITSNGVGTLYKYTVKDYADYILDEANGYDDKTKKLVSAMLNYGEYAKAYFNGKTLTATNEMDAVVDGILNDSHFDPSDTRVTDGTLPEGIEYQGMSLVLESDTILRLYFKVDESVDASLYNFDDNKGNYYYLETPVSANNIFSQCNFVVGDPQNNPENCWRAARLPAMYARLVFENDTASESLKNLCKALILYGNAGYGYSYGTYPLS